MKASLVFALGLMVASTSVLAADPDLDDLALGPVWVEPDDASIHLLGRDADVVDNLLHPAVRMVYGGQEVVVRRYVVVDDAPLSKIGFHKFPQGFTPARPVCSS